MKQTLESKNPYNRPETEVIDLKVEAIMTNSPVNPGNNESTGEEEVTP